MASFQIVIPNANVVAAPISVINNINVEIWEDGGEVHCENLLTHDAQKVWGDLRQETVTLLMALAQGHI